ncbi:MAG: protein-L-isoaspartate(D-aspartate) O-methyltransferase [Longimonas sp.]|uniref:protein-L-isoaspartate(D-aspartate) O-methyltransferase n=1 Tax=Longimonas sp. TaxID=2039626 RepID=UPI00334F2B52
MASTYDDRLNRSRRRALVAHLCERGIDNERVLRAIEQVPRHAFVEPAFKERAYEDEALPIGQSQTISQPFTVAYQTSLLNPQPGERILEVGTGSGYQAAVLCEMGAQVFSIERHKALLQRAKRKLRALDYNVRTRHGDGTEGWRGMSPFHGIIVTAGAEEVPEPLLDQLHEEGGRLVIPVGAAGSHTMKRIVRTGPDTYERESLDAFRFVPLVNEDE